VPEVGFGIGVSAGRAVAGNVGSEHRFEYTVIGDPVNEAARLCELAKGRPERLLASDAALERAGRRERRADRESDATAAMVDRQLGEHEQLDEVQAAAHLMLRSDRDPDDVLDEIEAFLDHRLAASTSAARHV
jgi:hypothetical protein